MKNLKIEPLAYHKNLIPLVAQWLLSAFGTEKSSLEKCEKVLETRMNTDCLNCCFLAFYEDLPIGTVSLVANDIPKHPILTPCISHLFVLEKYRHQNIGRNLIEFAKQKLQEMNFDEAYLFTTDPNIHNWYEKLGWKIIGDDVLNDIPIKIMKCEIFKFQAP